MRSDLVDTAVAALVAGVDVRTVQRAVRAGRLVNHGARNRVRVSLAEVCDVLGDAVGIR